MRPIIPLTLMITPLIMLSCARAADVSASDGCNGPCIEYSGTLELNAEWLRPSDDTIGNSHLIGPTLESNFKLKANDEFSFIAKIKSEPVIDAEAGTSQIFGGVGTYLDVLQAQYEVNGLSIWAGKVHPAFGRAWDVTPGLHGTDLAGSYNLLNRLGGGASISFEAGSLSNRFEVSAFTLDRTILSESLFNNRGRADLSDGGAGNASGVASIVAALDGCMGAEIDSCYDDGSLGYQLAARYQNGGSASYGNELGFLGSINKSVTLGEDTSLKLLAEAAWFRNFEGTADNALVVTGSAALDFGAMTYSLAYSQKRILSLGGADATEHLADATIMYALGDTLSLAGEKWSVGAGYTYDRADGTNVQTVGLKLSSEFGGSIPLAK